MLFLCAVVRGICLVVKVAFLLFADSVQGEDLQKYFKRVAMELRELFKLLKHEDIKNYGNQNRIQWKFIV